MFAINRFHKYCYGRHFDMLNDHKPLQGIFSKSLVNTTPMIQRLLLRLQRYDFDFQYIPGNKIVVSDCLSRAHLDESKPDIPENELNKHVNSLISNFSMTDAKLEEFKTETKNGSALQTVKKYVLDQELGRLLFGQEVS